MGSVWLFTKIDKYRNEIVFVTDGIYDIEDVKHETVKIFQDLVHYNWYESIPKTLYQIHVIPDFIYELRKVELRVINNG